MSDPRGGSKDVSAPKVLSLHCESKYHKGHYCECSYVHNARHYTSGIQLKKFDIKDCHRVKGYH